MACPAIETLTTSLRTYGPQVLREKYFDDDPKNGGHRLQAAPGPQKDADDIHATGRALDIILYSTRVKPGARKEQEVADRLVAIFLKLREEMRWGGLIYNRREWNSRGEEQPPRVMTPELRRKILARRAEKAKAKGHPDEYDKAVDAVAYEHLTHIHIEWGTVNADNTTFAARLNAEVSNLAYELDLAPASP